MSRASLDPMLSGPALSLTTQDFFKCGGPWGRRKTYIANGANSLRYNLLFLTKNIDEFYLRIDLLSAESQFYPVKTDYEHNTLKTESEEDKMWHLCYGQIYLPMAMV